MRFNSYPVTGDGRGRKIDIPTINLAIPSVFSLPYGVYGAVIVIEDKTYQAALHYGPIPTYDKKSPTLEIHLLNTSTIMVSDKTHVSVTVTEFIRPIRHFTSPHELKKQIQKDIAAILQSTEPNERSL